MCDDSIHHRSGRAGPRLGRRQVLRGTAALGGIGLLGTRFALPSWAAGEAAIPIGCDGMGEDPLAYDAAALAASSTGGPAVTGTLTPVRVSPPPIVSRAAWGADESRRTAERSFAPIRKAIVHQMLSANNPADPAAVVRSTYLWHVDGRGFADIGYNFLIDHTGTIYEGRWARDYATGEVPSGEDLQGNGVVGAHAAGVNTGSVGVCLLGTFTDVEPTPAALDALVHLLAWKFGPRGLDPTTADPWTTAAGTLTVQNVSGHRDAAATACPGNRLYALLPTIRQRVRNRLRVGLIGYRVMATDGTVTSFGAAADAGDPRRAGARAAGVAIAPGATAEQYYALTDDGAVYAFGGARPYGSLPELRIRTRAVDLASTPTGRGYWILGQDGGVFCFGDASFHGSLPGINVRTRAVDLAPTPTGRGYWLLGEDGGIFSFGDARFHGSIPGLRLPWTRPAISLLASVDGSGYHVVAADGGVFSFGSVPFYGSTSGSGRRPVGIAPALA